MCICWASNQRTHQPPFLSTMMDIEKIHKFFLEVISKFLGNTKGSDYQRIVENMLTCFQALGCRMSLKVHFHMQMKIIF